MQAKLLKCTVVRMTSSITRYNSIPTTITSLIVSAVLHLLIFIALLATLKFSSTTPLSEALKVELVAPPQIKKSFSPTLPPQTIPLNKKQIVSPHEAPIVTTPPPDAKLLSDQNTATKKEVIKRGMPAKQASLSSKVSSQSLPQTSALPSKKVESPKTVTKQAKNNQIASQTRSKQQSITVKNNPSALTLKLDENTALAKFGLEKRNNGSEENSSASRIARSSSKQSVPSAFSRPPGSGAAFLGASGVPDFLPNLPDGDLTLLNTKANQFAVFVRRVALRVFQNLRRGGWEAMTARDILRIADKVNVEAILEKNGTLREVNLTVSSGSDAFDQVVVSAIKEGAPDPNPPAAATLDDGTIRLFFNSQSWVRQGYNPRTGAPREERWIYLGTGLR